MRLNLAPSNTIRFGLLAIVLLLPMLVNPLGVRFYELPKVAFLRFVILLLLTVWLVGQINLGRDIVGLLRNLPSRPLVLPVLLFTFICILSTITSVDSHISFWGTHIRVQGTYNTLCYAIFFLLIIVHVNSFQQVEQLISAAIIASLPIALYGVLQHFGIEPIFPQYDHSEQVISTIGNSIFLGSYLIMVVPLALGRLLVSLRALLKSSRLASGHRSMLLKVLCYAFLLSVQLMCLLYTWARGPWLGLLGGLVFFGLLTTLRYGMKRFLLVIVALGVIFATLLVALNLPNTPLRAFTESQYLSHLVFSEELAAGRGTSWVRLLIWQGVLDLIRSGPNIGFTPDQLRPLRLVIGYGPETMRVVFPQVYPPGLAYVESREAVADRSHNELLDLVVTTGLLGLLAFLFLIARFFYHGASLIWRARSFSLQVSLIALLSAMFAHLVEAQFGILLPSVELLVWLYLALVSVMDAAETAEPSPQRTGLVSLAHDGANAEKSGWLRKVLSVLVACIIPFAASLGSVNFLIADTYLARGIRSQAAGQWKESAIAYNQAIQTFPIESRLYAFKAEAYFQLVQNMPNDEPEARAELLRISADALAQAREIGPLEPMYYGDAARVYAYWAKMVDPSKFDQAVDLYAQALQLSPQDAVYRNELARVYFDAGHPEEAIRQLQLSLEIDPKFYATHYNLGLVYLSLGEKDKAKEHFETGLLLNPGCGECTEKLKSLEDD